MQAATEQWGTPAAHCSLQWSSGGRANPGKELPAAPYNVTAANAGALFTALSTARANMANLGKGSASTKKGLRDTGVQTLRTRLSGTIGEIGQKLSDGDARWYTFGLNRPADPNTPGIVDGLNNHFGPAGSGLAYLDWNDARRATRYRVWIWVVGVDSAYRAVDTVTESDATLTLPVGKTVKVHVTTVNDAGESVPSADLQVVVP
ncbi:MAG: hypothetical protein ACJ8IQ_09345 [Chthoniobacterales bacterium]